jgi:DNA mismatch repair protein MutL
MARINILPDVLCNQIAAGEVVERPAAAVKELMENSIDAGSRSITVRILDAGRREIVVVDNGDGMSPDDALLAIERHATSKIRTVDDLQRIQSLGFRGEALPSIAAVSRFELVTRERQATAGTRLVIDGGILREVGEIGCPAGTQVRVRDLFFNVPARRKFLRGPDTEMAHNSEQFLRLAMAHPEIRFQLQHQGRILFDFPPATQHLERALRIVGVELAESLQPFAKDHPLVRAHGLIGPPELQRAGNQHLFVYINGRSVWDRILYRAILSAYESLLPKGRYPVAVVFLEMDAQLVDVNVHPTKREVRLRNPTPVVETIQQAVRGALEDLHRQRWRRTLAGPRETLQPVLGQSLQEREAAMGLDLPMTDAGGSCLDTTAWGAVSAAAGPSPLAVGSSQPWSQPQIAASEAISFADLPILGQLATSYILLEAPDGLVIIDQHAAHERVLYERLHHGADHAGIARQRLASSVILEFFPKQAALLRQWLESLAKLGYEVAPFGGNSFSVHAVPAALADHHPVDLLRDLVESAQEEGDTPSQRALLDGLTKQAACRQALKARQKLTREEMLQLLKDLDRTLLSTTCPHGRPLWWKLTHGEIARFFHRSQPPGGLGQTPVTTLP